MLRILKNLPSLGTFSGTTFDIIDTSSLLKFASIAETLVHLLDFGSISDMGDVGFQNQAVSKLNAPWNGLGFSVAYRSVKTLLTRRLGSVGCLQCKVVTRLLTASVQVLLTALVAYRSPPLHCLQQIMAGSRPVQVLLTVRPLLTAAVRICLQHKLLTEGAQFCLQAAGPSFAYSPAAAVSSGPDLLTAQVVQTTVAPAVCSACPASAACNAGTWCFFFFLILWH